MRVNRALGTVAALVVALGLGLSGCSSESATEAVQSEPEAVTEVDGVPVVEDSAGEGMPTVQGDFGEDPIVTPAKVDPPKTIVRQILVEGDEDGALDQENDAVAVNYSGYLWDGTLFDSSFGRGQPATFGLNAVIAGWKYGLTGTRAGDRVLLVIPPEYGYGADGQGEIPGDSTLVFVVEIGRAHV